MVYIVLPFYFKLALLFDAKRRRTALYKYCLNRVNDKAKYSLIVLSVKMEQPIKIMHRKWNI
jgi:hypothetical protein